MITAYPTGVDCVWIGSDADGLLGAFVTGGVGPIPKPALDDRLPAIEDIEQLLLTLPIRSTTDLKVSLKRPDDFIALAERGFFVYDWRDTHRTIVESRNTYELIAAPRAPLRLDSLEGSLAQTAALTMFKNARFSSQSTIEIGTEFVLLKSD
jgi:hypothetical protein